MNKYWNNVQYEIKKSKKFHESKLLKLNCNKAKKLWVEKVLNFKENIKLTAEWYQSFYRNADKTYSLSIKQIKSYQKKFIKNLR